MNGDVIFQPIFIEFNRVNHHCRNIPPIFGRTRLDLAALALLLVKFASNRIVDSLSQINGAVIGCFLQPEI